MKEKKKYGKHNKHFQKIEKSKSKKHTIAKEKEDEPKKVTHAPKKEESKSDSKNNNFAIYVLLAAIAIVALFIWFLPKILDSVPSVGPDDELGDRVVTVNGETIYSKELDKRLEYYQAQLGPNVDEEFVLNQSINELLLLEEAKEQGIEIDHGVVDSAVNEWLINLQQTMSEEQIDEILSRENKTLEDYVDDIRQIHTKNLIVYTLLNESVFSKIDTTEIVPEEVTEEDIRAEYDANVDMYKKIKASHILICAKGDMKCSEDRTPEEAKEVIDGIYDELIAGADFAELAKEKSDGPSGPNGGDLGFFAQDGSMVKEFEDAAFALKNINQISKPVKTAFGYHIIKLTDRKDSFEDVKTEISFQLQLNNQMEAQQKMLEIQQDAVVEYIAGLREDAVIVYHNDESGVNPTNPSNPAIQTFSESNNEICMEDGKPVVYLFSTTWCPHCKWITETYESTMQEYVDAGKIVAYHYELDINDDTMTPEVEGEVPAEHLAVYKKFNPKGSIPTFVFGCKYYRVGNGYEAEGNLAAEEAEFRAIIGNLVE